MPAQGTDPFSTAVLVGFIVALLGVIYRELRDSRDKRLAEKDDHYQQRLADKDKEIENRDEQIVELRAEIKDMAARSQSLATSAGKMLDFFMDREPPPRSEEPAPSRGRRT